MGGDGGEISDNENAYPVITGTEKLKKEVTRPMTTKQRLQVEQSEKRQAINDLLAKDELSDEQRTELDTLTKRAQAIETELRAAIVAEGTEPEKPESGDAEEREFRQLRDRVQVADYIEAALEMRAVDGAALEFNQAVKIGGDRFPLALLAPDEVEHRAKTDIDSTTRPKRWLDRLFHQSMARRLGVSFESVAPGVASFPVTTAGGSGVQRGREEAVAASTWTVGVSELKPSRNAVRVEFTIEDSARLPGLEDALVRDMRMALTESIDDVVFTGDDGANEAGADIVGLTTAASVVEKTLTQAAKVKPADTFKAFLELVDGKHAESVGDLSVVSTIGSNVLWGTTIANSDVENQTIAQFLRASGLSWITRGGIETATTANKFGAFVGRRRGIQGAGVAAVWESASLIRDPYSGASKGQIALTLNYLWNFGLPRPANFARLKFVT